MISEISIPAKNQHQEISRIQNYFLDYMRKNNLKSAILGMSGGIDSAFIAACLAPVCRMSGINLIGVCLPSSTNKPDETNRALNMCEAFCSHTYIHYIDEPVSVLAEGIGIPNRPSNAIRLGNIKARTRMIYLYDYAASEKGIVLGTDNFTELQLGFWTLHGDVGDLNLIQNYWKTSVYDLSNMLLYDGGLSEKERKALGACVDAVPTDGLGITSSDLEQLGAKTYFDVDNILYRILTGKATAEDKASSVGKRHFATAFKRDNPHRMPLEDRKRK